jgi:hypothetical protein
VPESSMKAGSQPAGLRSQIDPLLFLHFALTSELAGPCCSSSCTKCTIMPEVRGSSTRREASRSKDIRLVGTRTTAAWHVRIRKWGARRIQRFSRQKNWCEAPAEACEEAPNSPASFGAVSKKVRQKSGKRDYFPIHFPVLSTVTPIEGAQSR